MTIAIMPREQKSKFRTREKCHQARGGPQHRNGALATAAKEQAFPSLAPPPSGVPTCRKPTSRSCNPLTKTTGTLLITKANMLKIVNKKYKNRFLEILRRASFNLEVVFGVDLKEGNSTKDSYILVRKMDLPNNGIVSGGRGFPKTGLLMNLLGVIFMKGNCATEEKIWEFLNKMRVYAGKRHFIFGEPKKLITEDLVKLKYLEYRQVPNSNPARYEFLWGPRAHAETSKMKVLEFWAKINHTVPSAFHSWYEEALRDEEERVKAAVTLGAEKDATASESSRDSPATSLTSDEVEAESSSCG
uniref:MAGE domain-containing protein n=1 Tax=Canis lupus familiaris TaxID=9615 RepID=A0A8C0P3L1_CANLF